MIIPEDPLKWLTTFLLMHKKGKNTLHEFISLLSQPTSALHNYIVFPLHMYKVLPKIDTYIIKATTTQKGEQATSEGKLGCH